MQPWQRQNKESQPFNALDMHEVTTAVESLYADELKPYGRILRKRLAEKAATMGYANLDVDIKRLKSVCDTCPWIFVQAEEGGDWSALLQNRPLHNAFVDVYSPQDSYPLKMWQAAEDYFESLDDAHMVLPGGRYSCAQALVSRGLDFLHKRSLGQVCHIVQLAISQKKLLGYLNGAVVPYKRSQSMIKERCAEKQRPCTNTTRSSSDLADWDKVKTGLREILVSLSPGTSTIPLSNVKRLFRSRYHTELSETALGHSKLSELLQDPKLKDICHVRLQGHGYVVGPAGPVGPLGGPTPNVQPQNQHGQHGQHGHGKGAQVVASYQSTHQQPLMQVPVAPAPKCNMGMIPPTNLAPNLSQAAQGAVVISQAMRDAARPEKNCNKFYYDRPDLAQPGHPGGHPGGPHPGLYENERSDRPSLRDRAHFVPPAPLTMEDVEGEAPRMQVPWKSPSPAGSGTLRSRRDHFEATVSMGLDEMNLPGVPSTPLPQLMPATPDTPGFPKWSNNRAPDGVAQFSVQNTFIHCPMPPSTPCQGRSQSLPRNLYQRSEDDAEYADWSKSEALSQHQSAAANRLMSAAAAAADPLVPMVNQKVHPISAAPQPPSHCQLGSGCSQGFHPQNYTNPASGASTIRLADLL